MIKMTKYEKKILAQKIPLWVEGCPVLYTMSWTPFGGRRKEFGLYEEENRCHFYCNHIAPIDFPEKRLLSKDLDRKHLQEILANVQGMIPFELIGRHKFRVRDPQEFFLFITDGNKNKTFLQVIGCQDSTAFCSLRYNIFNYLTSEFGSMP